MSRSRKKSPGFSCGENTKCRMFYKRYANKKVRKLVNLPSGAFYKKVTRESYNIRDYNFRNYSRAEAIKELGPIYGRRVYQSWIK